MGSGGNRRDPVWIPVNVLLIRSLMSSTSIKEGTSEEQYAEMVPTSRHI
jgi:hypothetical protein